MMYIFSQSLSLHSVASGSSVLGLPKKQPLSPPSSSSDTRQSAKLVCTWRSGHPHSSSVIPLPTRLPEDFSLTQMHGFPPIHLPPPDSCWVSQLACPAFSQINLSLSFLLRPFLNSFIHETQNSQKRTQFRSHQIDKMKSKRHWVSSGGNV